MMSYTFGPFFDLSVCLTKYLLRQMILALGVRYFQGFSNLPTYLPLNLTSYVNAPFGKQRTLKFTKLSWHPLRSCLFQKSCNNYQLPTDMGRIYIPKCIS
jgi:hypothetical protein